MVARKLYLKQLKLIFCMRINIYYNIDTHKKFYNTRLGMIIFFCFTIVTYFQFGLIHI